MTLSPEAMAHSAQPLIGLLAGGEGSDAVLAQRGNRSPLFRGPHKAERPLGKVMGAFLLGWLCERSQTFLITDRPRTKFIDKTSDVTK